MMYNEDDFLQLSGIQHFEFCRRQWALIHIEMLWEENIRTVEGERLHEICHDSLISESRGNIITSKGMPVFSRTLGASGECDVVEFRKSKSGITLSGHEGNYIVYPIEYKRGEPKDDDCDLMQLAAQAICLEEMFVCEVNKGAIFYGKIRRRTEIEITSEVKNKVRISFEQMHRYFREGYIPKVKTSQKCSACSLKELCIPKLQRITSVKKYLDENLGTGGGEM
ncbi:MAG: CRISPR-associated protein Cas4 [Ruminococcus sp.]|nr:CRISPR-associated protein Cas4 [Ruminococcus sp.]